MVETSDISINCPGASLVTLHDCHPIGGPPEEAQCDSGWVHERPRPVAGPGAVPGVYFDERAAVRCSAKVRDLTGFCNRLRGWWVVKVSGVSRAHHYW
ncbi:hypothetical protein C1J00_03725 [Streptomyces cahuitamycinicus]|uniref:Uncharacterized protein n=1 Tax=Streptomyces cahuitamycinicus TaxID=2070367 RepID=A0A2N8TWV0_9ACTN|nr:hypothetical protein C1J00_03725 [Streptomyces cahuitamycinicus]